MDINEKGLDLISNLIRKELSIPCAVLMGANIAPEVANENYCEATIGKSLFCLQENKAVELNAWISIIKWKGEKDVYGVIYAGN